jgi:hypothetical protein
MDLTEARRDQNAIILIFGNHDESAWMDGNTAEANLIKWRLPSCAALVVFAIFISIAVCQADTALFLYLFVVGPGLILISIILLFYMTIGKSRPKRLTVWATLGVVWFSFTCSFAFDLRYHPAIRTTARWLVWSHNYKDKVLAEQIPTKGEFKHVEWDGWGWGGMDTTVYIVFDPKDSLSAASSIHQPGKFNGIPCEVPEVNRLESQWYTVTFYTGGDWNHCN